MLGRLFTKLFGKKSATPGGASSRPVSPPRPAVPSAAPPPPPPPPAGLAAEPARRAAKLVVEGATGGLPIESEAEDPLGDPFSDTLAPARSEPQGAPIPAEINEPAVGDGAPRVSEPPEQTQAQVQLESEAAQTSNEPMSGDLEASSLPSEPVTDGTGGVRIILEDGTLAKPSLDPELEERLRYIVDNIVPPSDPPSQGPVA